MVHFKLSHPVIARWLLSEMHLFFFNRWLTVHAGAGMQGNGTLFHFVPFEDFCNLLNG